MIPRSLAAWLYTCWDTVAEAVDSILERMGR